MSDPVDHKDNLTLNIDCQSRQLAELGDKLPGLGEIGLQNFAPYLMNRIMGRYNQTIQSSLSNAGITTLKMRILAVLSVVDGISVNELAIYTVAEQSTLSRTLTALEDAGLVYSSISSTDNRIRFNHLTEEGSELFNSLWPQMHASYNQMFAGIDDDQKDAFIGTLRKILRNIRVNEV